MHSSIPFTGVSFFNAIYNPTFNAKSEERRRWLKKFKRYGINVLRIFGQWDNKLGLADACSGCTLYDSSGQLQSTPLARLKAIVTDADAEGMVVELTLFGHESWVQAGNRIEPEAARRAVQALVRAISPWRNVVLQIWNEHSEGTVEWVKVIKAIDPKRLVTSSPGGAAVLGDEKQNQALDFLTPHTARQYQGVPWMVAPREISYLLARYRKPVVDDEPARNGTAKFGGPGEGKMTYPTDHILQIWEVWKSGGHVVYHHDMFQAGYGAPSVPPHGIPDPEWSPYHREVFEFLAKRDRYAWAR